MAAVCNSVYFDCLQEFQQDITTEIIKKDVKVDRLTEKAKKKGLLPSRLCVRPDSEKLAVSRENKVANLVSLCIDSIKRNGNLFHSFLALLEDVGLHLLVSRIRRTLEQAGDRKPKLAPLSCDSGVSTSIPVTSAGANGPSLTSKTPMLLPSEGQASQPMPVRTRRIPTQSGNSTPKKQMDRARRTRSLYDERSVKIVTPTESCLSPALNESSLSLPMQETQEDQRRVMVVPDTQQKLRSEDHRNVLLDVKHAEARNMALQEQTQQLKRDKATLQKLLKDKEQEIESLKLAQEEVDKKNEEQINSLKEKVSKDEEELEKYKTRTAELERQLEENNQDMERKLKEQHDTAKEDLRIMQAAHKQEIEKLEKELSEQKALEQVQTAKIATLQCELYQKELQKVNEISAYKDQERALERERDQLRVELEVLRRECLEKEKEEEKCRREAAERGHRQSQAQIAELKRQAAKHSNETTSCHDGCTCL